MTMRDASEPDSKDRVLSATVCCDERSMPMTMAHSALPMTLHFYIVSYIISLGIGRYIRSLADDPKNRATYWILLIVAS